MAEKVPIKVKIQSSVVIFFNLNNWPVYFKKTKGCQVWDLDNKKFYDFSFMGLGTNILGYNNNFVDNAVRKTI